MKHWNTETLSALQKVRKIYELCKKKTGKSRCITPKTRQITPQHATSRQNKTNHATSCHITPNRASASTALRTFAVGKVLPLGLTDKKRFIARHSLKRTFASWKKEEKDTLEIRSQHVESFTIYHLPFNHLGGCKNPAAKFRRTRARRTIMTILTRRYRVTR